MRRSAIALASAALALSLTACSSAGDGEPTETGETASEAPRAETTSSDAEESDNSGATSAPADELASQEASCTDPYAGAADETDEYVAEFQERTDERDDETLVDLGETVVVEYHDGIQNHNFELTVHSVSKADEFNGHTSEDGCYLVAEIEAKSLDGDYFIAPPYIMRNLRNADGDLIRTVNDELDVVLENEGDGASHGPVVYEISEDDGTGSPFFQFYVGHDGHTVVVRQDQFEPPEDTA